MLQKSYNLSKLQYRSCYRGVKELDYLLCEFAITELPVFTESELVIYTEFLNQDDHDIFDFILEKKLPPQRMELIINKIRLFNQRPNK